MAKKFLKEESSAIVVVLQSTTTNTELENLGQRNKERECKFLRNSKFANIVEKNLYRGKEESVRSVESIEGFIE